MLGYPMYSKPITDHVKSLVHQGYDIQPILLVHDVIPMLPLAYPSPCPIFKFWLNDTLSYVKHFICNSQTTYKDLSQYLYKNDIRDCQLSTLPLSQQLIRKKKDFLLIPDTSYFLFVGNIGQRKNGISLLHSFANVQKMLPENPHKLVIVGKQGLKEAKVLKKFMLDNPSIKEKIVVLEDVTDEQLAALYSKAYYTVIPSLYEGWGLPAGESLWNGAPCICANNSALPEVAGNASLYFDPFEKGSLDKVLYTAIKHPEERETLLIHLSNRELRTWKNVAYDLKQIIDSMYERHLQQHLLQET